MTTTPRTTRTIPVARLSVLGEALFANTAAILAQISVNTMHSIITRISGVPPIAKWDIEPVSAVKVIMNTLVPTAVFSSYPSREVRISNIIIPPPAPMNPQMNPITIPATMD